MKYDNKYFYFCEHCQQEVMFYHVSNNLHECGPIEKKLKKGAPYWYKYYTEECVLCGAGSTEKERQYSPKPKDPADRHEYKQTVCGCHFV